MLGWLSLASERASWRNRFAGSLVGQGAGGQDFYGNLAFQLLIMR